MAANGSCKVDSPIVQRGYTAGQTAYGSAAVPEPPKLPLDLDALKAAGASHLPGLLGIEVVDGAPGRLEARLALREAHLAPNGYLHAATVIALADTACGYGCILSLPEGATGFTTIELKANFLRTALTGTLECRAERQHAGRTTQVWDATVTRDGGEPIALFRCTQMVLWPR
jgi:1,4-dihydroxy-2-naphthoyl-CoA hydrolase